jgi:hypothetical protein
MRMPGFTATPMLPIGRDAGFPICWCRCGLICTKGTDICWLGCECHCWQIGPVIINNPT